MNIHGAHKVSISKGKMIRKIEASKNRNPRLLVNWSDERESFFHLKYKLERLVGWGLLFASSPLILLIWVLVKLDSKGPGFYHQPRVGLDGREFEVYKIRTMKFDPFHDGKGVWCKKNDARVTWLGKYLRKLHLDELPQLYNVAKGDMVLVGPRPEQPSICDDLIVKVDGYLDRVKVKPGITGLSQINLPPDTSLKDVQRKQILDLHYINETNLFLEIRILLATALRVIGIRGELAMKSMLLCRESILRKMNVPTKHFDVESESWSSFDSSEIGLDYDSVSANAEA